MLRPRAAGPGVRLRLGRGEAWAIVAAIAFTLVNITLRSAAVDIDPYVGSALRQVPVAVLGLGAMLISRGREFRPGNPGFIGWTFVAALLAGGFLSFVIGNVLYFVGLAEGGLGITVSASQGAVVFAGMGLGIVFLRERPRREQWLGAIVIGVGLVLVAIAQAGELRPLWVLGLLAALLAGSSYAATNVATRLVQRERPMLFVVLAGTSAGGLIPLAVILTIRALAGGGPATEDVEPTAIAIVLLAGVFNAVALIGLTQAMRESTVATTNTLSASQLVFSFVASVLLFNEVGSPAMVLGVVLVMAGIAYAQTDRAGRSISGTARS